MVRPFWFTLGLVSLAVGAAGIVLPLVPATPLLLLAAYSFARSSPRLHAWLIGHPQFGRLINDWREHGSIARNVKITAMIVIVATLAASVILGVPAWIIAIQAVTLTAVTVFILTHPDRPNPDA